MCRSKVPLLSLCVSSDVVKLYWFLMHASFMQGTQYYQWQHTATLFSGEGREGGCNINCDKD